MVISPNPFAVRLIVTTVAFLVYLTKYDAPGVKPYNFMLPVDELHNVGLKPFIESIFGVRFTRTFTVAEADGQFNAPYAAVATTV